MDNVTKNAAVSALADFLSVAEADSEAEFSLWPAHTQDRPWQLLVASQKPTVGREHKRRA